MHRALQLPNTPTCPARRYQSDPPPKGHLMLKPARIAAVVAIVLGAGVAVGVVASPAPAHDAPVAGKRWWHDV